VQRSIFVIRTNLFLRGKTQMIRPNGPKPVKQRTTSLTLSLSNASSALSSVSKARFRLHSSFIVNHHVSASCRKVSSLSRLVLVSTLAPAVFAIELQNAATPAGHGLEVFLRPNINVRIVASQAAPPTMESRSLARKPASISCNDCSLYTSTLGVTPMRRRNIADAVG
jgi:hypothetical protein